MSGESLNVDASSTVQPSPPPSSTLPFPKKGIKVSYLSKFVEKCGGRIALANLTTTQVNDLYQKPMTLLSQSSFCDLIESDADARHNVGTATVFISHAWKFVFLDVVEALETHFADSLDTIIFFDMFSNNQHLAVNLDFDWWCTTFKSAIAEFHHTVMVMAPWGDPIPLTRGWCCFELYCTATTNSLFEVAMSKRQKEEFFTAMFRDSQAEVQRFQATINVEKSECFKVEDKERIFEVVRESIGFDVINRMVFQQMHNWIRATTRQELEKESDPIRRNNLRTILCGVHEMIGDDVQVAENLMLEQIAETTLMFGGNHVEVLGAKLRLAAIYDQSKKDTQKAFDLFRELYPKFLTSCGPSFEGTLLSQLNLGIQYVTRGDFMIAKPLLEGALAIIKPKLNGGNVTQQQQQQRQQLEDIFWKGSLALGHLKTHIGQYQESEELLLKVRAKYKETLGADHPSTIDAEYHLTLCLRVQKRYTEAIPLAQEILRRRVVLYGRESASTSKAIEELAILYDSDGHPDRAVPLFQECIAFSAKEDESDDQRRIGLLNGLGVCYVHLHNYELAEETLTEVVARNTRLFGANSHNPSTLPPINNLAVAKENLGKLPDAAELYVRVCHMKTLLYGPNHPSTQMSKRNLLGIQSKMRGATSTSHDTHSHQSYRFRIGDRVVCAFGGWASGIIIALNYSEPTWPRGTVAPYQVQLDNGLLICAPYDTDDCIRRLQGTSVTSPSTSTSVPLPPTLPTESNIESLIQMGFSRVQAVDALTTSQNSLAIAIERLLV